MPTKDEKRWFTANTSQTAIFLWQGFMEVLDHGHTRNMEPEVQKLYESHFDGLGEDGGALSVGYVAAILEEEYTKRWREYDSPTVYHYDIIEPLGSWWAKEGPKLHEFQYGPTVAEPAIQIIVRRYNEMVAGWLAEDKLTS